MKDPSTQINTESSALCEPGLPLSGITCGTEPNRRQSFIFCQDLRLSAVSCALQVLEFAKTRGGGAVCDNLRFSARVRGWRSVYPLRLALRSCASQSLPTEELFGPLVGNGLEHELKIEKGPMKRQDGVEKFSFWLFLIFLNFFDPKAGRRRKLILNCDSNSGPEGTERSPWDCLLRWAT